MAPLNKAMTSFCGLSIVSLNMSLSAAVRRNFKREVAARSYHPRAPN